LHTSKIFNAEAVKKFLVIMRANDCHGNSEVRQCRRLVQFFLFANNQQESATSVALPLTRGILYTHSLLTAKFSG